MRSSYGARAEILGRGKTPLYIRLCLAGAASLHDQSKESVVFSGTTPEHSFAYTKKTIEPAFGRKLLEIFDNFEDKPVASGSIAQMHRSRATLRFSYPGQHAKPHSSCRKVCSFYHVAHLSKGSCPFVSTCSSCCFGGNL
ncbi:hypothetical protein L3X38_023963 [Prunus dulcis]|uniref:ABC1 atypical kinase-like domain-containing protein n=1 Tax=Prunus dulcis TaxID=3755 RepID=A0AAD4Z5Z1_PRUDU|nr:hypothetical protein L3X38_023963 [Prunus dulcis]